jgi:RimJ/RimL family protein N-acetyltransferase
LEEEARAIVQVLVDGRNADLSRYDFALVLRYGFGELDLHRVYATCRPANDASRCVLEKLGMRREGHLRRHRWMKGTWHDSLLYAILVEEWR